MVSYMWVVRVAPVVGTVVAAANKINYAVISQFFMRVQQISINSLQLYPRLVQAAQQVYPGLQGFQNHHVLPTYIATALRSAGMAVPQHLQTIMSRIPTAYHTVITQEIRALFPFGNALANTGPNLQLVLDTLARVYQRYPLP